MTRTVITRTATALSLSVALVGCQPSTPVPVTAPVSAPLVSGEFADAAQALQGPDLKPQSAQTQSVQTQAKFAAQGAVHTEGQSVTLQLRLPPLSEKAAFATQALNLSGAQTVVLSIKDSNGQVYLPQGAEVTPDGGELPYPVDGNLNVRFEGVFPSALLVARFHVLDAQKQLIPQTQLATSFSHLKDTDADVQMNFASTPAAQVLAQLLDSSDSQVRLRAVSINPSDLHLFIENILSTQADPVQVDVAKLAEALKTTGLAALQAQDYRLFGAKVNVTVTGLAGTDGIDLQLTDAVTRIIKGQGNTGSEPFVFKGVPAATGLKLLVSAAANPGTTYTFAVNPTTLTTTEGGSHDVTVTATAAKPTLSPLTLSSGTIGSEVTLTGENFHTETAGNMVRFGATTAEVTSATATELKVKVPAGIAGQVNVTVVVGSQMSSAQRPYAVIPELTKVAPNTGGSAGGTSVTLTGSGFTGATAVKFGDVAATSFKVDSNTQITAVAPAGTLGATDVTVVTAGGTSVTGTASKYTYADSKGFVITGLSTVQGSVLAKPITPLGDMNGDGIDDFAVCDLQASTAGKYLNSGKVYVIYGGFTGKTLDVTALTPAQGFVIEGDNFDTLWSVASAGDVNGDGKPDMVIGAPGFSSEDLSDYRPNSGRSYVVYGGSFTGAGLELKNLTSTQGFRILGQGSSIRSGTAVAGAGDFNGDGKDDIIVGGPVHSGGFASLVYGGVTGGTVDLKNLTAAQGFTITNIQASDARLGSAVKGLGDLNGDGKDDIIVGAPGKDSGAGEAYVIYGGVTGNVMNNSFDVDTLANGDGSQGFVIIASEQHSSIGSFLANPGDLNGDGKSDILLGLARHGGVYSAASIIPGGFTQSVLSASALGNLVGSLFLDSESMAFGTAVSAAGDVNGDGKPDFIVGAPAADGGDGRSYVFYGKAFQKEIDLSLFDIDGSNGFIVKGPEGSAGSFGRGVAGIGDINGDGKADLAASAEFHNVALESYSQKIYVIYGGANQGSGTFKVDDL